MVFQTGLQNADIISGGAAPVPVAAVGVSVAPTETSETSDDEMLMVGEWQNAEGVEGERRMRPARQHPTALYQF
jgi:hypothetical protein